MIKFLKARKFRSRYNTTVESERSGKYFVMKRRKIESNLFV